MKSQVKAERVKKLIELLRQNHGLSVGTLAAKLGVSHMTVRRDLADLAADDQVRQFHGGVVLSPRMSRDTPDHPYSLGEASTENAGAKARIGRYAADLIRDGDNLIIDSGTTTEYLAEYLPPDMDLTVLAYSLNIVNRCAGRPGVRMVVAGGELHPNTLMLESSEGLAVIGRYRAHRVFISAAGISEDMGVTCRFAYERATKTAAMESAVQTILLADSSKFGLIRSEYFATIDAFDMIITDNHLDSGQHKRLEDLGIQVVCV